MVGVVLGWWRFVCLYYCHLPSCPQLAAPLSHYSLTMFARCSLLPQVNLSNNSVDAVYKELEKLKQFCKEVELDTTTAEFQQLSLKHVLQRTRSAQYDLDVRYSDTKSAMKDLDKQITFTGMMMQVRCWWWC